MARFTTATNVLLSTNSQLFFFLLKVSNRDDCIRCVRQNSNTTRVFTFGIGEGADRKLVAGMAKVLLNNNNKEWGR
jgi:hypothetical protein